MIEITDEVMNDRLSRARGYTLMFLKVGSNYQSPDVRSPEQAAIVREHGRRNMALRAEGKILLVGPVKDARPIIGISIFAGSEEEARALMADDPGFQAGLFELQYSTWYGVAGDTVTLP